MRPKRAIVFLCDHVHKATLEFAQHAAKQLISYDVFIVMDHWEHDDHIYRAHNKVENVRMLAVNDRLMKKDGFFGCNINGIETHIKKQVIAYDKFLYLFTCNNNKRHKPDEELRPDGSIYDFVWVFEQDVFIPSPKHILYLHQLYGDHDLVVPNNIRENDNPKDWHWPHVKQYITAPFYRSMVCAAGFSSRMLDAVEKYRHINGRYFHIEAMFNTIAMHEELKVAVAPELKSCVWMGEWEMDEFIQLPDNLFHPIKDIDSHAILRSSIEAAKASGYVPKKPLPEFLQK